MEIFLMFFGLAVVGSFVRNRKINVTVAVIILMAMGIMVALRGPHVGADTSMYLSYYRRIKILNDYKNEFLFYAITTNFLKAGFPREWSQVALTVITYVPLIILTAKYSKNACLTVLMFIVCTNGYFYETFNIARQWAATSYLLCAYFLIKNKKLIWSLVCVVAACGMHTSSLIYIPFVILAYKVKFSSKAVYVTIAATMLFALAISNVGIITGFIEKMASYAIGGTEKYVSYVTYKIAAAHTLFGLLPLIVPVNVLCVYAYDRLKDDFGMRILFLGCVFLNIVSIMPTAYRMAFGMVCMELFIYPQTITSEMKHKWIPIGLVAVLCLWWCFMLGSTLKNGDLIPYDTF